MQARQAADDMRSEAAAARQRESAALHQLAQAQADADQQQADMRYVTAFCNFEKLKHG